MNAELIGKLGKWLTFDAMDADSGENRCQLVRYQLFVIDIKADIKLILVELSFIESLNKFLSALTMTVMNWYECCH